MMSFLWRAAVCNSEGEWESRGWEEEDNITAINSANNDLALAVCLAGRHQWGNNMTFVYPRRQRCCSCMGFNTIEQSGLPSRNILYHSASFIGL